MRYAIISFAGQQYRISEGDEIVLPGPQEVKKLDFDKVLLLVDGDKVMVGTPTVSGAKIDGEVVEVEKGKKINVSIYKAKSRYRKHKGARPIYTRVKITKISSPAS